MLCRRLGRYNISMILYASNRIRNTHHSWCGDRFRWRCCDIGNLTVHNPLQMGILQLQYSIDLRENSVSDVSLSFIVWIACGELLPLVVIAPIRWRGHISCRYTQRVMTCDNVRINAHCMRIRDIIWYCGTRWHCSRCAGTYGVYIYIYT